MNDTKWIAVEQVSLSSIKIGERYRLNQEGGSVSIKKVDKASLATLKVWRCVKVK